MNKHSRKYYKKLLLLWLFVFILALSGGLIFGSFSKSTPATGNQFTTAETFGPVPFDPEDVPEDPVDAQEYYYSYGFVGIESFIGSQSITISHGAHLQGSMGTNGSVSVQGGGVIACGDMRNGNGSGQQTPGCPEQGAVQGNIQLPDVVIPSGLANNNSNSRLGGADPVDPNVWQRGNVQWNPTTRVLRVTYSWLRLQGSLPYFLCRLEVTGGSNLIIDTTERAQIFFDRPENCPGVGADQLVVNQGGKITRNGPIPGFFLRGSENINTSMSFSGGINMNGIVIYAPRTTADISAGFYYNGALISKSLNISGGGTVENTLNLSQYPLPII